MHANLLAELIPVLVLTGIWPRVLGNSRTRDNAATVRQVSLVTYRAAES